MLVGLGYPSDEGEPLRKRWRQSLTEETGEVSIVDLDSSGADDDSPAHHMMIHSKEVDAVEEAFQKMTVSLSRFGASRIVEAFICICKFLSTLWENNRRISLNRRPRESVIVPAPFSFSPNT